MGTMAIDGSSVAVCLAALVAVAAAAVYGMLLLFSHRPRAPYESELSYITTTRVPDVSSEPVPLPREAQDGIDLSVVVPCYNETRRLKMMFQDCIEYLNTTELQYEILIVDDGSKDGTAQHALDLAHFFGLKPGQLRVVKFVKNRGKGGAVTHGMKFIRGQYGIFCDADGASKFGDVAKLLAAIKELERGAPRTTSRTPARTPAVAIGSRAHMVNTDAVVKRTFVRNFLMYSLHALVYVFGIREIKDTQCGFKLFNRAAIEEIFPAMHTEGWIFDVEILILAARKRIPVAECAISWHEVDGSKMDLARDSIDMAIDLVVTRLAYLCGIYKDNKTKRQ